MKNSYGYVVYYYNQSKDNDSVSVYSHETCLDAKSKVLDLLKVMFQDDLYFSNDKQFITIIELLDRGVGKMIFQFSYSPGTNTLKKDIVAAEKRLHAKVRKYLFVKQDRIREIDVQDTVVSVSYNLDLDCIEGIFWSETRFLIKNQKKSIKRMKRLISNPYQDVTISNHLFRDKANLAFTRYHALSYCEQKETATANYELVMDSIRDCYNLYAHPDFGKIVG